MKKNPSLGVMKDMLKRGYNTNKNKDSDKETFSGVMKIFLIILVLVIIGIVFLSATRLNTINVEGNSHYSNEEIIDLVATKETDKNTLLFYLRHEFGKKENIPFIEKIDTKLTDRNTVQLQVYENAITGAIEYMESYMYFDREGIIVEASPRKIDDVPIVSGLKFSKLLLHEPIEVDKPNVFQIILNVTQLIYRYDVDVNVIYFTKDLEIILYQDNIRILLGKRDSYDEQIAQLPNLLSSLESREGEITSEYNKKLVIDMKEFEEGQDKIIITPVE